MMNKLSLFLKNNQKILAFFTIISLHFWIFVNHHPIQYYSDSYTYLELSQNLSNGNGYHLMSEANELHSFYPPLYSITIALFHQLSGMDFFDSVTWIAYFSILVFFFFFNKILQIYRLNTVWRLATMALLWFSLAFTNYYVALSEHLFFPLFLAQVYYLLKWLSEKKSKYLHYSSILMGLMLLARYASLGVFAPEILWVLWIIYKNDKKYLNAFHFIIPASIIFGIWNGLLITYNSSSMGRKIVFHPPNKEHLKDFATSFANWFSPGFTPYFVFPVYILLVWILLKYRKQAFELLRKESMQLWNFIFVGFMLFITITVSFIDHTTSYDTRILIPAYFAFIIFFILFFAQITTNFRSKILQIVLSLIIISHTLFFIQVTFFSKEKIQSQELINMGKNASRIYSNTPDLFPNNMQNSAFLHQIPYKYNPKSTLKNKSYQKEILDMKNDVINNGAVIIYFNGYEDRMFSPSADELQGLLLDITTKTFSEGIVIGKIAR